MNPLLPVVLRIVELALRLALAMMPKCDRASADDTQVSITNPQEQSPNT